jgi:hypothetical protein
VDGGGHDLGEKEGEGEVALARESEGNRIYNRVQSHTTHSGNRKIR